jgi:hypothetical protein
MEKKIFDIKNEPMPRGAWWWWFWLFFFDNPKNPEKPRQLMILWSTKNVKEIYCNDLRIKMNHTENREILDGAVASWYFDGERMHHNYLLEQCNINIKHDGLSSTSSIPTSFSIDGSKGTVRIGKDIEFVAETAGSHEFLKPSYRSNTYIGSKGYYIIRMSYLKLSGKVNGEKVRGSAYFQRVFVNVPSPPWFWGIFHFDSGSILTYFNPHIFGKSIKKEISFFDGKKTHKFVDMKVKKSGKKLPKFTVSGENASQKIRFTVEPYSHSSWTFRKKSLGFVPNKLVYNEYPAVISAFELDDKKTGKKTVLGDLGKSVGNAEHTTGLLF